ncbi:MAG: amino acid permease [Eubacterium sp.]|nr:amino acid permease [Eubacterium sp.]
MQNDGTVSESTQINREKAGGLQVSFTPLGMWAFSIGTSIGWGSFIVTCNTYLQKSGILGTIFGLLLGMAVVLVITWNLQHMIRYAPNAGGVYTFVKANNGKDLGFISMWFILLTYLAVLWANITSVPLFARFFLGDMFQFGFHYTVFGYEVRFGEALLSIGAVVLIGLLCMNSSRIPNKIMIISALAFAVAFAVCAVIAIFRHGSTSFSYSPMFAEGSSAFRQIVRIAVISPWAFIGFENISHFSEEYAFPVKKVRGILIWSVVITTALYLFVSLLSVSAYPPQYDSWLDYIQDMGNLKGIEAVPAFYAANYYLGQTGVTVLMLALFAVILTSLIGNMLALSRLLYAAGREEEAPRSFAVLNRKAIPSKAILAIVAVSVLIPFLGRTAIGWIVDVTTLGATIIFGLISYAVYRFASEKHQKVERVTGIVGAILMILFVLLLLIPGLLPFNAMETESYILFIVWAVLGLIYFRILIRRDKKREHRQHILVWIILLVLVLFASMMWVSRETEKTAKQTVNNIYEYHQAHASEDADEVSAEERVEFLNQQADKISSTNTLFTMVSLGIFLLFTFIMMSNYNDTKKLGSHLKQIQNKAHIDALTGVKNKNFYRDEEERLDLLIETNQISDFAIVILDVNNLKTINDNLGHQEGDKYILKACKIICDKFKKSPVFRIGGDEFIVLAQGEDYENLDQLMNAMTEHNTDAVENGGIVIACGMARYDSNNDERVSDVFDRADQIMYENKNALKKRSKNGASAPR